MASDAVGNSRYRLATRSVAIGGVLLLVAILAARVSFLWPLDCPDVGDTCSVQDHLSYPFTAIAWWLGSLGGFAIVSGAFLRWRYRPRRRVPSSSEA